MSYGTPPPPPPPPGGGYGAPPPPPEGQPGYGYGTQPEAGYGAPQPPYGQQPPAAPYQAPGPYGAPPPANYGAAVPGAGALAQWPQRALGYLVDYGIALPGSILVWVGMPKTAYVTINGQTTTSTTTGNVVLLLLGTVLSLALWVWNRGMKGGQGQTIGRKLAGVTLVDAQGAPLGTGRALVRDIAHILDSIICGLPIGWLAPLWDSKRQTWGDKVMNTYVLTVPK
ncbi:MAG TPA: RDD family protein [Dermatophilaceae bacterium]|nr:RDD family protein [Dermatophilaceae bacterium]